MKIKAVLIILVLATSCVTQKKCLQKFPPTTERDSVYIETLREVQVMVPGDSLLIEVPIDCPDQNLADFENTKLRQQLRILNRRLQSQIIIKPDTVIRYVKDTETIIKEVKVPQPVKYIPPFYKQCRNICILFFALAFGYGGIRLYKLFK